MRERVLAAQTRVRTAINRLSVRPKLVIGFFAPALIGLAVLTAGLIYLHGHVGYAPAPILLRQSLNFMLVLLAVAAALSLAAAWALARLFALNLLEPVEEVRRAAEAVASGNLDERPRVERGDELGTLAAAVSRMTDELARGHDERFQRLADTVHDSERMAREIQTASMVILEITETLTDGSTRQRESVTSATSQAGRLGQAGASIALNARQIDTLTTESLEACEQGSLVLQDMLGRMEKVKNQTYASSDRMKELLAQARKVRSVIELIEEISDQINLIALNAELEAAGAGEAGRRFAVVAEEVTRLAERTLTSTRVINEAIDEIIRSSEGVADLAATGKDEVDVSMASTEEVGLFLVRLFERVEKVGKQVQAITVSTEDQLKNANELTEQLTGIEELARKMEAGVMDVQNSIGMLEKISEDLTNQVSAK